MKFRIVFLIFSLAFISFCSSPNSPKVSSSSEKTKPTNGVCLSGDCWNGKGTFEYLNKDRYIGEFKEGLPHGEGLFIHHKGMSISGGFQNGKVHGFATELDENRRLIYSGEWIEGKKKN